MDRWAKLPLHRPSQDLGWQGQVLSKCFELKEDGQESHPTLKIRLQQMMLLQALNRKVPQRVTNLQVWSLFYETLQITLAPANTSRTKISDVPQLHQLDIQRGWI